MICKARITTKPKSPARKFTLAYLARLTGFAFLCLYFALLPCLHTDFYSLLLFHPLKYPKGDYQICTLKGIQAQELFLQAVDGSLLHARYFKNPGSRHTILIHHGTGMNLTMFMAFAMVFIMEGDSVLLYDYRGFGRSSGSPSCRGICEDAQSAYDFLAGSQNLKPSEIINFGISLGTGPASYVSARNPCGGLILISPYCSLQQAGREKLPYLYLYPSETLPGPDICTISVIDRVKAPVLIIHGEKDLMIAASHSKRLFERISAAKRLVLVKEMGHSDWLNEPFLATTVAQLQSFAQNPSQATSLKGVLQEI